VVESAVAEWRRTNPSGRLVFTNGCFDILHSGHVAYLQEARSLGDALFVGLNSDSSVRRLKGPERPVNDELARARVLSALRAVDLVGLFSEDTPLELIRRVRPDVLVKGGDWKKTAIVGWDFVESYGGQVRSLVFVDGFSTTGVIEKIRARS
jgi:rfaE bifunctional protein nucleotidyltransferase chain/domain